MEQDMYNSILTNLKNLKPIVYILIAFLIIVGLSYFTEALRNIYNFCIGIIAYFQNKEINDAKLKQQSLSVADELMRFISERKDSQPIPNFKNQNTSEWHEKYMRHTEETMSIYRQDFALRVAKLRNEFLKRGLQDKTLNSFYKTPTNYFGLQDIAFKLAELADKLPK